MLELLALEEQQCVASHAVQALLAFLSELGAGAGADADAAFLAQARRVLDRILAQLRTSCLARYL